MARRRRGGLMDANEGVDTGVEILDLEVSFDEPASVVEGAPGSRRTGAVVAALMVAGLATLGAVSAGNTPAPEPPAPSVTIPPDPISDAAAERQAEIAELEATYGVEIGDGPDLTWHPVVWNIKTNQFQWIDDGFVGHNGETEWTIRPGVLGPSVGQRQSPELTTPGYRLELVDGARLLIPDEGVADHLLVLVGEREPIRIDLEPSIFDLTSDLARPRLRDFTGAVVDDRLVLTGLEFVEIDRSALEARTGRDLASVEWFEVDTDRVVLFATEPAASEDPIVFDDLGFTGAEIADLRLNQTGRTLAWSIDLAGSLPQPLPFDLDVGGAQAIRTATGAAVAWSDDDFQSWFSTSTDGDVWSTAPIDLEGELFSTGPMLYSIPEGVDRYLRRSSDLGRTWQRTRTPFENSVHRLVVDDVLVVAEEQFGARAAEISTIGLDLDEYTVTINGAGRSFELADPDTGEVLLSGAISDSASAAAFDPFGNGLAISDPTSGDELLTIPQGMLLEAFAAAVGAEPPDLAVTRWDRSADDPEWRIEPLADVFADAVTVEFVPGDGQMLAIVTTARGYDYYVARTEPS